MNHRPAELELLETAPSKFALKGYGVRGHHWFGEEGWMVTQCISWALQ